MTTPATPADAPLSLHRMLRISDSELLAAMASHGAPSSEFADPFDDEEEFFETAVSWVA